MFDVFYSQVRTRANNPASKPLLRRQARQARQAPLEQDKNVFAPDQLVCYPAFLDPPSRLHLAPALRHPASCPVSWISAIRMPVHREYRIVTVPNHIFSTAKVQSFY